MYSLMEVHMYRCKRPPGPDRKVYTLATGQGVVATTPGIVNDILRSPGSVLTPEIQPTSNPNDPNVTIELSSTLQSPVPLITGEKQSDTEVHVLRGP